MKIGLTGSIACGKSTVSDYLRSLGYFVADADAVSRALTAPGGDALPAIREAFGDGVFDGAVLNRRALGDAVFSDEGKRALLNSILHPMIISTIDRELEQAGGEIAFADVPLLYECGMEGRFDRIWVVSAPQQTQIDRLMLRDGLSKKQALARIQSQMPLEEKRRRADSVIHTDGPIPQTQKQVRRLLTALIGGKPQ